MLRGGNRHGRVLFTDISRPGFFLAGRSQADLMARIHGRLANGSFVEGVEVFRQVYAALGYQKLVAVSRWPGIRHLLDAGYAIFARNRLRWTGQCNGTACPAVRASSDPHTPIRTAL